MWNKTSPRREDFTFPGATMMKRVVHQREHVCAFDVIDRRERFAFEAERRNREAQWLNEALEAELGKDCVGALQRRAKASRLSGVASSIYPH